MCVRGCMFSASACMSEFTPVFCWGFEVSPCQLKSLGEGGCIHAMHLLFYHYFLKLLHEGEVGGSNWDFPLLKSSSPHVCVV